MSACSAMLLMLIPGPWPESPRIPQPRRLLVVAQYDPTRTDPDEFRRSLLALDRRGVEFRLRAAPPAAFTGVYGERARLICYSGRPYRLRERRRVYVIRNAQLVQSGWDYLVGGEPWHERAAEVETFARFRASFLRTRSPVPERRY